MLSHLIIQLKCPVHSDPGRRRCHVWQPNSIPSFTSVHEVLLLQAIGTFMLASAHQCAAHRVHVLLLLSCSGLNIQAINDGYQGYNPMSKGDI